TEENASGTRVYVMALRDIDEGEELFYDYGLVMEGKITKKLRDQYLCLCGSENCRGTMLALPEKKALSEKEKKKSDKKAMEKDEKKSKKDKASGLKESKLGKKKKEKR